MSSYVLRDRRLADLSLAIAASTTAIEALQSTLDKLLVDDPGDLKGIEQLRSELGQRRQILDLLAAEDARLDIESWRVADRTVQLVAMDKIWAERVDLRQLAAGDLARIPLNKPSLFTDLFQNGLNALPRVVGTNAPDDLLVQLTRAAGGDQAMVDELLLAVHRDWLEAMNLSSPFDHVNVMLPVRLETLFVDESLWIRVIPDEIAISRHRNLVSEAEKSVLLKFWRAIAPPNVVDNLQPTLWLNSPEVESAWLELCRAVRPVRAAWLVSNILPGIDRETIVLTVPPQHAGSEEDVRSQTDKVVGLPESIEVWATYQTGGGLSDALLGTLQVSDQAQAARFGRRGDELKLTFPQKDAQTAKPVENWLIDFEAAIAVGLGGKLELDPDVTAESIVALYVLGIGETHPGAILSEHDHAGSLAIMRLGTPTNSVHGAPAADLAQDARQWLSIARNRLSVDFVDPRAAGVIADLQRATLGVPDALTAIPIPIDEGEDAVKDVGYSQFLMRMLWPVLWGHYLRDQLGQTTRAYDYWRWCNDNLYPEGPLPPLRIKEQPYGVLPVSITDRWTPDDVRDTQLADVEAEIAANASLVRQSLFASGKPPNLIGADTQGILTVLGRDALTQKYAYRFWLPYSFLKERLSITGISADGAWENVGALPVHKGHPTQPDVYLTAGFESYLDLPLIIPSRWPDPHSLIDILRELFEQNLSWENFTLEFLKGVNPDSLLVRLMIESVMLVQAWGGQEGIGRLEPVTNPIRWRGSKSRLQQDRDRFTLNAVSDPLARLTIQMYEGMREFADRYRSWFQRSPKADTNELARWHRALRATLDSACHRLDPWVTGLAWRRLQQHSQSRRSLYTTGLYGWVDGPFHGKPGPTDVGVLHAPSFSQAVTSTILRDKHLNSYSPSALARGQNSWQMEIDSRAARQASELADEIRMGFHLFEVVGRRVEQIVAEFQKIRQVRKQCPQHAQAPTVLETCHGLQALDGLRPLEAGEGESEFASRPLLSDVRAALSAQQQSELRDLHLALDAYSDLLMADAVHHVVTGQAHRAADAMDSLAGLGETPTLESIRTPTSGYRLRNTVVAVIPYQSPSHEEEALPCHLGEASLASYLEQLFPEVDQYQWIVKDKASGDSLGNVTLRALGWSMPEAALLPEGVLASMAMALVNAPSAPEKVVQAPKEYLACRKLWGCMGRKPASIDLFQTDQQLAIQGRVESIEQLDELTERLQLLRQRLTLLGERLEAAVASGANQPPECRGVLKQCLGWGILPNLTPNDQSDVYRFVFTDSLPQASMILGWLNAFQVSFQERMARLDDAPAVDLNDSSKRIVQAMCCDGGVAILARWSKPDFVDASQVDSVQPVARLEAEWLPVVATVREDLARLEAVQLQGSIQQVFAPMVAWSNRSDPWQSDFVQQALASGLDPRFQGDPPPMVAAFGPGNAWSRSQVAVGLIDEFHETIPMAARSTYAAFGFNAPAARAQQAVLLAVPPVPRTFLDSRAMLTLLQETRQMTRVRAMRQQDVAGSLSVIPSVWLPGAGPDGVRLENDPVFNS